MTIKNMLAAARDTERKQRLERMADDGGRNRYRSHKFKPKKGRGSYRRNSKHRKHDD